MGEPEIAAFLTHLATEGKGECFDAESGFACNSFSV